LVLALVLAVAVSSARKTHELHSAAQAGVWADGDFDADHGFSLEPGTRPHRGGGGGCARALAVYKQPPPKGATGVNGILLKPRCGRLLQFLAGWYLPVGMEGLCAM
jgi:hypothetical protein